MGAWRGCGWGARAHVSRASGLVVAGRGCVGRVMVLSRVVVSVRRGLRVRVGVRGARDAWDVRPGCARGHSAREGAFVYATTWLVGCAARGSGLVVGVCVGQWYVGDGRGMGWVASGEGGGTS